MRRLLFFRAPSNAGAPPFHRPLADNHFQVKKFFVD
jgi:hypothetical protein